MIRLSTTKSDGTRGGDVYDTHQTGRRCRAGLWPGAAGAGTGSRSSRKSSLWSCLSASLWSYRERRVDFVCFLCVCVWYGSFHCDVYSHSPHLQEDLPELCSHLHQRVQVATVRGHAEGLKVVGLEFLLSPAATETQHKHELSRESEGGEDWPQLPLLLLLLCSR